MPSYVSYVSSRLVGGRPYRVPLTIIGSQTLIRGHYYAHLRRKFRSAVSQRAQLFFLTEFADLRIVADLSP